MRMAHSLLRRMVEDPDTRVLHRGDEASLYCSPHLNTKGEKIPGHRVHLIGLEDMDSMLYRYDHHCPNPWEGCARG